MARITILLIFLTLILLVLNLRDGQNLPIKLGYFNLDQYEENYKAEVALQDSINNPKEQMEGHENHSDEDQKEKVQEPAYALTTKAEFVDGAHVVKMLNKGANGEKMVFEPAFLRINPGDKVRFIPVDKGHMAQTMKGGIPNGASSFESKVNETYTQVFDQAGAYAIKCKPHYTMGMVAMIVVGQPTNLEQIKSVKVKGKKGLIRWNAMLQELGKTN